MNNFYELSTKDKDMYRGEFNKLKFTKDVNVIRWPALLCSIFGAVIAGILDGLVDEGINLQPWVNMVDIVVIIAIAVFFVLEIYLNICFMRWMKIKHKVEY